MHARETDAVAAVDVGNIGSDRFGAARGRAMVLRQQDVMRIGTSRVSGAALL